MAAAAGRNARTTTPPSWGWAPRIECGLACSRRTMRSRSAAVAIDIVLTCLPSVGFEQPPDPGHGDPHPVGTVVELVAQLVDGLLELEDCQQLLDRVLAGREQARLHRVEVALQERLAGALLPA